MEDVGEGDERDGEKRGGVGRDKQEGKPAIGLVEHGQLVRGAIYQPYLLRQNMMKPDAATGLRREPRDLMKVVGIKRRGNADGNQQKERDPSVDCNVHLVLGCDVET